MSDISDLVAAAMPPVSARIATARLKIDAAIETFEPDDEQENEWREPVLFGEIETPEITAAFLPNWVRDYVEAVADHTQTPVAVAAILALAVLASCLQKRLKVTPYEGYTEPLSLWVLVALPPASRKTALLQALREPIIEWEREELKRLTPEIERQKVERAVIAERIKELTKQAGKAEE
jgi:hypothetical protein